MTRTRGTAAALSNPIHWLRLYGRALAAMRYASKEQVPGLEFASFGRRQAELGDGFLHDFVEVSEIVFREFDCRR